MAVDLETGVTGRYPYPLPVRTQHEASLVLELLTVLAAKTDRVEWRGDLQGIPCGVCVWRRRARLIVCYFLISAALQCRGCQVAERGY